MSRGASDNGAPELIELIDRLEGLLNDSELSEIEIEAGQTALVLRKPSALPVASSTATAVPATGAAATTVASSEPPPAESQPIFRGHVIAAPLTGLFYNAPSPGAEPYVREGGEVGVGQVIGLIEAMKLFNEIKSDVAGRVVRIHAESGALVKSKQALIEVEP